MPSTIRLLNKLIDSLHKAGIISDEEDLFLHFVNEALIHGRPDVWARNFLRFGLPMLMKTKAKPRLQRKPRGVIR